MHYIKAFKYSEAYYESGALKALKTICIIEATTLLQGVYRLYSDRNSTVALYSPYL
jgi:hypothetical protein